MNLRLHCSFSHQLDHRHFRRGQEPYRRAPGAGAATGIEHSAMGKIIPSGVQGIGDPAHIAEGEYLAPVRMTRQLEVEEP